MRSVTVAFDLEDVTAERAFLREYMVPAWGRFRSHEAHERGWFWRFGNTSRHGPLELEGGTTLDGGGVVLVLNGEPTPEPLVEAERPRWNDLVSRGLLEGWDCQSFHPTYENARAKAVENFGRVGGDRAYRLRPLVSRFTLDVLSEFDERLPAVGPETEENRVPMGYWAVIHFAMKQHGLDWYDEIDACTKAIENRLHSLASFEGDEEARQRLRETISGLEDIADELSEPAETSHES